MYAFKDKAGELSTNICTRTIRSEKSRSNLAYLRGERVAPAANKEASTATTKLCGRVVPTDADGPVIVRSCCPVGNKSPVPNSEAGPDREGLFCVTDVDPGKYHLLFVNRIEEALTSFVYFPGVTDLSEATAIDISPGHPPSDLVFNIPAQATFSVSGTVSNSDNPRLPAKVTVMLMSASQPLLAYTADAATVALLCLIRSCLESTGPL